MIMASYTQGLGIDEPLAISRAGALGYYNTDGLGSITEIIDSNGLVAAAYKNQVFGVTTNLSGSLQNPFQYTGREFDAEIGLYYYRARSHYRKIFN